MTVKEAQVYKQIIRDGVCAGILQCMLYLLAIAIWSFIISGVLGAVVAVTVDRELGIFLCRVSQPIICIILAYFGIRFKKK